MYRVRTCPLFQHYGKDNTIRNNIFAFGANGQLQRCREDIPCHHVAEGNLVYADVWTKRAKGAFGTALLCDPVAHTAIVKDAPSLQFGTGDFSIELWLCPTDLKIDSSDRRRHFLSKDGFPDSGWNLNVTVEGKPFIEMRDANKVTCANRPSGRIPENTWTHLVVVVDRANAQTRYYYNGVLDSAQDLPAGFTGALDARAATSPSA